MAFTVRLSDRDTPLVVAPGETILSAGIAAGLPLPHGCKFGNCGACKCRLVSGDIHHDKHSAFALTDADRADGLILACRATPRSDLAIELLEEEDRVSHPIRDLVCTVRSVDDLTHDIKRIRMRVAEGGPFQFSAGQFATVTFGGAGDGGDMVAPRDYSMANRPVDPTLEFHIRHVQGGAVSAYLRERLEVGERVRVEGPFGVAWLRESHTGPIWAVAGGSGLAPMKSIVETALAKRMTQPIRLYFGVRDERDLYAEPLFRALERKFDNFSFTPVLSSPTGPTERRTGFVHEVVMADLDALGETLDGAKIYTAGPPVMVEALTGAATARGLPRADVHADPFYTAADLAAQAAEGGA